MGKRRFKDVESGVDIVEGLMGAGKSYWGVRKALDIIMKERRPVVTNLPFKWRVVRRWLRSRGGEELSKLLIPLTHDHFLRFLERAAFMQRERDRYRQRLATRDRSFFEFKFRRLFLRMNGPHLTTGSQANWIPPMSVIIYDEMHHDFPGGHGGAPKTEPPQLKAWVTMIRHHHQQLYALTQNRMQLTITLRRLMKSCTSVRSLGEEKLAWGIRFRHLGSFFGKAIRYVRLSPEALEAPPNMAAEFPPLSIETIFPSLPKNVWYFRLYSSFTHGGSERQMVKQLHLMREQLGLRADGKTDQELEREEEAMRLRPGKGMKLAGRSAMKLAVFSAILGMGIIFGRSMGESHVPESLSQDGTVELEEWGEWKGYGVDFVRVGGDRIRVGETVNGATLLAFDRGERVAVFDRGGYIWMWEYRASEPERVGPTGQVIQFARDRLEANFSDRGAGIIEDVDTATGAVGIVGGDADG